MLVHALLLLWIWHVAIWLTSDMTTSYNQTCTAMAYGILNSMACCVGQARNTAMQQHAAC